MSSEIDTALSNLSAIKNGKNPRRSATISKGIESDDALEVVEAEVDRLFNEDELLREYVDRDKLWCGVSRNDGRNGVCKYNKRLTKRRFNKRITGSKREYGHHTIVINEKILEQGNRDGFIDTIRHEVAHVLAYEIYGTSQGHNGNWKAMASRLGADPSSCHNKRDRSNEYNYYIYCPECGMKGGKTKRSKVIKQPFTRKCGRCGHHPLSSYEAGEKPPEESGIVAVESIPWNNRAEWAEAGRP